MRSFRLLAAAIMVGAVTAVATTAAAFCGFYVSGADASLFNNATNVVLMREDRRTVLSMRNNYQGPPEDFALVIPVPQVLQEENVKTLPDEVFRDVDRMAAPRLVEYWEQDPCMEMRYGYGMAGTRARGGGGAVAQESAAMGGAVRIEAQFEVGEYEIVILSSDDSTALDTWLRQNDYQIPEGAEPLFRPYIESGQYFFVAKVNVERVEFNDDGQAMLSPLRFHYDSDDFQLPIRLGLINSSGEQDLLVHILSPNQRYEVANYPNVTIPTNLDVDEDMKQNFASFYAALFDRTRNLNENAVVTEYSWNASTCDPCPGNTNLTQEDFALLGADVLGGSSGIQPSPMGGPRRVIVRPSNRGFVLTRLHMRYAADDVSEDLVFRKADPISGGRGTPDGREDALSQSAEPSRVNNFQGRYIIKHLWEGEVDCENPVYGRWGGPPGGRGSQEPATAPDTAFADRDEIQLASAIQEDVPALQLTRASSTQNDQGAEDEEGSDDTRTSDNTDEAISSESGAQSSSKKNCSSIGLNSSTPIALMIVFGSLWMRRRVCRTCGEKHG